MIKLISQTDLSDNLTLSECADGFWLYDSTRGMNLAMRAKSTNEAFTQALTYYQERLIQVESDYKILKLAVDAFVDQINEDEES